MRLQEKKIHNDRIRGTPEIGCRHTTPSPAGVRAAGRMPACRCSRPDQGMVAFPSRLRRESMRGAEHVHLLTIHGERGAGWLWIDLCGTPLIPSDARGHTTCLILPCLIASPRAVET
jgi:hypothetical protein